MDAGELEKFKVRKPVADLVRSRPDFAKIRPANYLRASPKLNILAVVRKHCASHEHR